MQKTVALAAVVFFMAILPVQSPAQSGKPTPETAGTPFEKQIGQDQEILHALNRLTFGPRPGDIAAVEKMGLSKWMDLQLHPERLPEDEALTKLVESLVEPASQAGQLKLVLADLQNTLISVRAPQQVPLQQLITDDQAAMLRSGQDKQAMDFLATLPREKVVQVLAVMPVVRQRLLPLLDADLRTKVEAASAVPAVPGKFVILNRGQPGQTLAQGKLYRAIRSDRQLEEVLVDFWYNHFNVDAGKGAARLMVTGYERNAIRPHVLGQFRDLLEATANSAAMMFYLDNWQSAAQGLNENYARELMELQTLGVNGGYTQKDIVEVARCFTGWTIDNPNQGGAFIYNDQMHDKGEKTVLGVTIPSGGGKEDGEKVLDILARHPSTARFVSTELAQRFVADDPPPALIERMAQTFHETDGDVRAVLTTLFSSKEFFSDGAYRSKLKTPLEMVVSAVRATGAQVDKAEPLVSELATLGEPLYRKLEPTGYSNRGTTWVSSASLLERMNFALRLAQNLIGDVKVDQEKFSAVPATAARQVLFTGAEKQTLEAIGKAIGDDSGANSDIGSGLIVGMLIGSPDFQRR